LNAWSSAGSWLMFRRPDSSSENSGLVDLADVRAEERARQKREDRERRAAERQKIWGDRSRYSVRDHVSYWAEILIERERERRAEKEYRRSSFRAMMEERREKLDQEMRPEPKLEQQRERGKVIEHNVLDELRHSESRSEGEG